MLKRIYEDLSDKTIEMERLHLTVYLKIVDFIESEETNNFLREMEDTLSNIAIALRMFLIMALTNYSREMPRAPNRLNMALAIKKQFSLRTLLLNNKRDFR